jgi:hypothetical protein
MTIHERSLIQIALMQFHKEMLCYNWESDTLILYTFDHGIIRLEKPDLKLITSGKFLERELEKS